MVSKETITQTEEDINNIPRIKVESSFIKEIIINKQLIARGDLKGNPPIYTVKISIMDDIGGRHKVTTIEGFVKDKLEVRI